MLGVFHLIIGVTIDIIGKEPHGLHIREQTRCIRQQLALQRRQKGLGAFQITFQERFINLHIKMNVAKIGVVLGPGIGG